MFARGLEFCDYVIGLLCYSCFRTGASELETLIYQHLSLHVMSNAKTTGIATSSKVKKTLLLGYTCIILSTFVESGKPKISCLLSLPPFGNESFFLNNSSKFRKLHKNSCFGRPLLLAFRARTCGCGPRGQPCALGASCKKKSCNVSLSKF